MSLSELVDEAQKLLADGSSSSRSLVAAAVAKMGELPRLDDAQRREWRRLVALFARDRATVVRAVLAETVKRNPELPPEAAERLARDVIDVARPILAHSEALSDDVLIDLVEEGDRDKQDAIVNRRQISEDVARVIIDECDQALVARLAANNGAELSDDDMERMLERFDNAWPVVTGLAKRNALPRSVAEKVITQVSGRLKANLRAQGVVAPVPDLPSDDAPPPAVAAPVRVEIESPAPRAVAQPPVEQPPVAPGPRPAAPAPAPVSAARPIARPIADAPRALSYRLADASRDAAQAMHKQGKLKPLVAVKELCTGDLAFFETALSLLAGLPLATVQSMLHDPRVRGFNSVNEKARMPGTFMPVIRAALAAIAETPLDGMPGDRGRFVEIVIARILTQMEEVGGELLEFLADNFAPARVAA
ncbi:MAG: DUF2336 domain-containing protein [Rhodospirillales bacterium]|jgi:uncharacterized protein (DUF2336 family)